MSELYDQFYIKDATPSCNMPVGMAVFELCAAALGGAIAGGLVVLVLHYTS